MKKQQAFIQRIAPSGIDRVEEALEANQLIIGWAEAGGLLDPKLEWEEFREIVRKKYYPSNENLRGAGNASGHLWRFIRDMDNDDLVVVPHYSNFYIGRITGSAIYDENKVDEDSAYRRPVEWLNGKSPIPRVYAKSALTSRMGIRGTNGYATDLLDQINDCLSIAKSDEIPSFENDLERKLLDQTLNELRSGRMKGKGYGFEELIETVFRGLGAVSTERVSRKQDKGIDIYARFTVAGIFQHVVGIQAKHFQPDYPVGSDVVDQLIRGIREGGERVTLGMVITSGIFSDEATIRAEKYEVEENIPIELVDGEQFAKLIVEYGLRVIRDENK